MKESSSGKTYGYIRFSNDDQGRGSSVERQVGNIKKCAQHHGRINVDIERFRDLGKSSYRGENLATGALGEFLRAVKDGEIGHGDWLIVESLDRLSRQGTEETFTLLFNVTSAGVTVVTALDDQLYRKGEFDLMAIMRATVAAQLANQESAKKSERICAAWAIKREALREKKITGKCPGWLKLSPDKKTFTVIEDRARLVRRIFTDTANGLGRQQVTRALNEEGHPVWKAGEGWSAATLAGILISRAVIGEFTPCKMKDGKRVPVGETILDYFPAVISHEEFYAAQSVMQQRRYKRGKTITSANNLFTGLCFCGYCNGPVHYVNKSRGAIYLRCDKTARGVSNCGRHNWSYRQVESTFMDWVVDFDFTGSSKNKRDQIVAKLSILGARSEEATRTRNRLIEAMSLSTALVSTFVPLIEKAEVEARELKEESANLAAYLKQIEHEAPNVAACGMPQTREDRFRFREEVRRRADRITIYFSGHPAHPKDPDKPFYRVSLKDGTNIDIMAGDHIYRWHNGKCYEYNAGLTIDDYMESISA